MAPSEPPLRVWRMKIVRGMSTGGAAHVSELIGERRGARKSTNKRSVILPQGLIMQGTQPFISRPLPWTPQQLVASMDKISEMCGTTSANSTSNGYMVENICFRLADFHLPRHRLPGVITKSRLEWLLSRLSPLEIPRDPVITRPVLNKFELFEELPVEIRFKIWGMLSCLPRKVKLLEQPIDPAEAYLPRWYSIVEGQSKHPAVVHICKESREEALRYYTICYDKFRYSHKFMGLRANIYFINFAVDTFVHGSSQFEYEHRVFPGAAHYNFGYEFLRRVQRIEHLPCYQAPVLDFSKIYFNSAFTMHHFRQDHWESLREVTMVIDDVCFGHKQETLAFNLYSRRFTAAVRNLIGSNRLLLLEPDGSSRSFQKMKFDIKVKWKYIRGDEELDLVPCKPQGSLYIPWLGNARHYPCGKHLRDLSALLRLQGA